MEGLDGEAGIGTGGLRVFAGGGILKLNFSLTEIGGREGGNGGDATRRGVGGVFGRAGGMRVDFSVSMGMD